MLELAEDEQIYFFEKMKKMAFEGKTPVEKPVFTALIGAPGSGKSTLAAKIENSVIISADNVIAEYAKELDIDVRERDFLDKDIAKFASNVNKKIITEAIKKQYNITYDTSAIKQTMSMIEWMENKGYKTDIKVMLVDEYQAAMNVAERKADYDDAFTRFKRFRHEGAPYPKGNPLHVMPNVSGNVSCAVDDFVQKAVELGFPIEIYEFGKDKPSFKTGDDFDKFIENLQLKPMEEHIERCDKLKDRMLKAGKEDYFMQLELLKKQMSRG